MDAAAAPSRTVVVGGGPAGLACAIMLARRGWTNIEVWERLPRPPAPTAGEWGDPNRSYCIRISGRGQVALARLGCTERVLTYCKGVNGRMDWTPENPEGRQTLTQGRKYVSQVIQRDRLVACLLEEVEEKHAGAIQVMHGVACTNVEWLGGGGARLTREPTGRASGAHRVGELDTPKAAEDETDTQIETKDLDPRVLNPKSGEPAVVTVRVPFVVGAEGASLRNAVMSAMESDDSGACDTSMVRFDDANPRVYKTIPIHLPASFRTDLSYSARSKGGVALECLPTKEGLLVCGLNVKSTDKETLSKLESKASLRKYFDEDFPMFTEFISDEDLALMAERRMSTLPTFAYAGGGCLHRVVEAAEKEGPIGKQSEHGEDETTEDQVTSQARGEDEEEVGGACLLGDSIHTVKPYFGLGVDVALEDVTVLDDCLTHVAGGEGVHDGQTISGGGRWTDALPEFSRRRAADAKALVDISHGLDGGFLTFVLPIILDAMFHKMAPALFMPNTIQMLQKEDWTFSQVGKRKRRDRAVQVGIIATVLTCVGWALVATVRTLVSWLARSIVTGGGGIV
mmetsp:Transcript_35322/g.56749  ORF Transcript_35322/g.56749 Transcript_35322/m.56749 type:complete len:570 (-) Transcript_35322:2874-4583(-)